MVKYICEHCGVSFLRYSMSAMFVNCYNCDGKAIKEDERRRRDKMGGPTKTPNVGQTG